MFLGARHLENGEHDGAHMRIMIDGKGVEKGVIEQGRGVVSISAERHVTEVIGEADINYMSLAGLYWRRDGLVGRG